MRQLTRWDGQVCYAFNEMTKTFLPLDLNSNIKLVKRRMVPPGRAWGQIDVSMCKGISILKIWNSLSLLPCLELST